MIFPCDRCGLCCRHLEQIPQLKDFDSGDGKCVHLLDNNECLIYNNRPNICNVSKMFELYFKNHMTEEEYIAINMDGCIKIKTKYGRNNENSKLKCF